VVAELLAHPATMIGLSDAGAHASQLCDACAPTELLGKWVREKGRPLARGGGKTADEVLSNLQEAIALHLEGEDLRSMGLTKDPRLVVTYEVSLARHAAEA
jgi:hypothetical protein